MKALVLTDGKAGHENQSKALVRALGCEAELVEVHFKSKFHKALSYLLDHLGIRTLALFSPPPPPPLLSTFSVVLGTGSGTFYAAKAMAKKLGVPCGVVLYPRGYDIASFDCVLAPSFDCPKAAPNVIEIPANLVANDVAFYEKGVAAFRERTSVAPEIAVIIGGPNKCSTMTVDWMKGELDKIFGETVDAESLRVRTENDPSSSDAVRHRVYGDAVRHRVYCVTTSRRTPPEVEALVDSYPWDYKLIYSRDHFNPIPAFVSLAKKLYVTAESTGMLSEACTFGAAEVHPLDNLNPGPHKFRRFMEGLVAAGCARGEKLDLAPQFARARTLLGLGA